MGFDKNDSKPLEVTTEKKTTQVNISMIVAVVLFFIGTAIVVVWVWKHPHENAQSVEKTSTRPN